MGPMEANRGHWILLKLVTDSYETPCGCLKSKRSPAEDQPMLPLLLLFLLRIFILFFCACFACIYVCAPHVCRVPAEVRKWNGFPGIGVRDDSEPP